MTDSTRTAGLLPRGSGIILPIPEAEAAVGRLHRLHDPQASFGVPSHITLLYPFAHPSKVDEAAGDLQKFFRLVPAFEFSLVEVRRFPATAYLHPEPSAPLLQLTEQLAHRWPEFPPYGGLFSGVIPHLRADRVAAEVLDAIDREF